MSFKINYKGTSCRGTKFLYICDSCAWEQEEVHAAADTPSVECCNCHIPMHKKPTAPAFDADHHESMKTQNLGWEGDNGKDQ